MPRGKRCSRSGLFWLRLLRQAERRAREDRDPARQLKHKRLAAYLRSRVAGSHLGDRSLPSSPLTRLVCPGCPMFQARRWRGLLHEVNLR